MQTSRCDSRYGPHPNESTCQCCVVPAAWHAVQRMLHAALCCTPQRGVLPVACCSPRAAAARCAARRCARRERASGHYPTLAHQHAAATSYVVDGGGGGRRGPVRSYTVRCASRLQRAARHGTRHVASAAGAWTGRASLPRSCTSSRWPCTRACRRRHRTAPEQTTDSAEGSGAEPATTMGMVGYGEPACTARMRRHSSSSLQQRQRWAEQPSRADRLSWVCKKRGFGLH